MHDAKLFTLTPHFHRARQQVGHNTNKVLVEGYPLVTPKRLVLVTPLGGQFPLGFGGGALNPTFRKSPFGIL